MGKLESLDQPLFFQVGERSRFGQANGRVQLIQRPLKILEPLFPANVISHDLVPFRTDKRFHHSSTAVQCFP